MYHIALSKTKHLVFVNANPMSIQVQTTNLSGQLKILLPSIMLQRTDSQHKNVKKKNCPQVFLTGVAWCKIQIKAARKLGQFTYCL